MDKHRKTVSDPADGGPAADGDARSERRRLGSRFAFSLALTALMLGTFLSFGGFSYAATQTRDAVHTLTKVAAAKRVVVHQSSAADQYHKNTHPGQTQEFTPPSGSSPGSTGTTLQAGTLPFTGLSLAATALVSGLLLLAGIVLRRRERRSS
jgi:cytoskeletal protein RodZ